MKIQFSLVVAVVIFIITSSAPAAEPPEPGPENAGLRVRLVVAAHALPASEGYDVLLEVLNLTNRPITLRAGWGHDQELGDVRDYIEASSGIETYPPIAPWIGQIAAPYRTAAQPELVLKAGEVLSVRWRTNGRRLKNRVSNSFEAQNPEFPLPGLYSVHAMVAIITSDRTVQLRSNEQLVPVGGSREMPKHSYGMLIEASAEKKTGTLNLGSLQKIERGDQFQVWSRLHGAWKLTVTEVHETISVGSLEPVPPTVPSPSDYHPPFPERNMAATLMPPARRVSSFSELSSVSPPGTLPVYDAQTIPMNAKQAESVPVVLRVRFVSEDGSAEKYGWSRVKLLMVLKNESKHAFTNEFTVAHLGFEPGVPPGVSTLYLERYNGQGDELWKLRGGSARTGVSHVATP